MEYQYIKCTTYFLVFNLIKLSSQGNHPIPYALSPVYLQYLENIESQFYDILKTKSLKQSASESQQDIISRYVKEYEHYGLNKTSFSGFSRVSSNPILSLQMINRYVKYFQNSVIQSIAKDLISSTSIPEDTAIDDAMEGLLRLQYVYDLDASQLADGILDGLSTDARLNARECFDLGKFAQESAYFTLALQWFDVTLRKLKTGSETASGLKEHVILKAIRETIDEHNQDYDENMQEGDMYSFSTPIYSTNYSSIAHLSLRKRLVKELTGKVYSEQDPLFYQAVEANMMILCNGQSLQKPSVTSKLKCWYDTKRHPYWTVNPLKIEMLNNDPPIIQLYDIFYDKWINYLKTLSYNELERAPQSPEATPRTAAYAWFEDNDIPNAPISKTVEFITGLNVAGTEASEALQVAAYAFGGHVEPHFDSRGPDDPEPNSRGDRVTTFLVYLNEVEKGGLTAFPLLGLYVRPVKNSAVLWYTNLKNGDVDPWSLHAACPVISGQKWIATKWTHINENILKRPCGLTSSE